jgi:nucleolar protein 12
MQPTPPTRQEIVPQPEGDSEDDDPDAELSEIDEEFDDEDDEDVVNIAQETSKIVEQAPEDDKKRKRKRKDAGDEIEDVYMRKLEKEEAKDQEAAAKERASKRQKGA